MATCRLKRGSLSCRASRVRLMPSNWSYQRLQSSVMRRSVEPSNSFCEITGPTLSDFAQMSRRLWVSFLPQAGHSELALKHMLVATASLHETVDFKLYQTSSDQQFFARHYS